MAPNMLHCRLSHVSVSRAGCLKRLQANQAASTTWNNFVFVADFSLFSLAYLADFILFNFCLLCGFASLLGIIIKNGEQISSIFSLNFHEVAYLLLALYNNPHNKWAA